MTGANAACGSLEMLSLKDGDKGMLVDGRRRVGFDWVPGLRLRGKGV